MNANTREERLSSNSHKCWKNIHLEWDSNPHQTTSIVWAFYSVEALRPLSHQSDGMKHAL